MQSIRDNKWFQTGLFVTLIASIAGQWQRVLSWVDGLPGWVQFAIGALSLALLSILGAYILGPYIFDLLHASIL